MEAVGELSKGSCDKGSVLKTGEGPIPRSPTIERDQVSELLRMLDGKKASLRKTYKPQTEANDKSWEPNGRTGRALALLARVYDKYEEVGNELDVDKFYVTE